MRFAPTFMIGLLAASCGTPAAEPGESESEVESEAEAESEGGAEAEAEAEGEAEAEAAAESESESEGGSGTEGDGDEWEDDDCHYDCFGYHTCEDGVVTTWENVPVGCDDWTGECPYYESCVCERGCRMDIDLLDDPFADPCVMCEENRPKLPGDPCTDDTYCIPTPATLVSGCDVANTYLECDEAAGECVEREPPVIEDYLAPCGVEFDDVPDGAYGFVDSAACVYGLCLIESLYGCVAQGCTGPCERDDQCPPGSTCQPGFVNWTGGTPQDVCHPGPVNAIGCDLECP